MNDRTRNEREIETAGRSASTGELEPAVAKGSSEQSRNRSPISIALVAVVVVLIGALALWWFLRSRSGAGRPVPAPRNVTLDQSGPTPTTEASITLAPEMINRGGIKIEVVGQRPGGQNDDGAVATGVVQANAYRTTPVISLVGGIVRRVNFELGQNVRLGEPVAVVFSDELALTQSRYLSALAELEEHHKHHYRTTQLVEIGAASREELDQATTKLRAAESEVASQRQRLLLLGLSPQRVDELNSPSQVSSEITLPAPVSGTVISRSTNPGEVIAAGKEILRIADLSTVWVIGQVYEKDLGRIRVGTGANVATDTYPGRVFRGRVGYVDPALDQATRTAQVRIELANPQQSLKIGMFVKVSFATSGGSLPPVPIVSKDAVQNLDTQQVVFVATREPNVFTMRRVRIGPESNGSYPVIEGLSIGERIVTEGSFLLRAEWQKANPGLHSH